MGEYRKDPEGPEDWPQTQPGSIAEGMGRYVRRQHFDAGHTVPWAKHPSDPEPQAYWDSVNQSRKDRGEGPYEGPEG